MNISILSLVLILPFLLDGKKDEPEKLTLNVTSTEWYTYTNELANPVFCQVHLKIKGNSNAELITVQTFGDGIPGCVELKCNSVHKFDDDIVIQLIPLRDSTKRKYSTEITAYSSRISPHVPQLFLVGSGETLGKYFRSPLLNCK